MEYGASNDARACMPNKQLLQARFPECGEAAHAIDSPLPYGIGVYAVEPSGAKRFLPLYYVSPLMAAARGREVLPGWYVVAVPDEQFELRLTAMQRAFPHINEKKLPAGSGVSATVRIDGYKVGNFHLFGYRKEIVLHGFEESMNFVEGENEGTRTIRLFKFQKTETKEGPVSATPEDTEAGSLRVRIYSGPFLVLLSFPRDSRTNNLKDYAEKMSEKEAIKYGKSVKVRRDGGKLVLPIARNYTSPVIARVLDTHEEGNFVVYFREKFWMTSHNIIKSTGEPWRPDSGGPVINVDDPAGQDDGSPRKKVKREPSLVRNVKDVIDLTNM